ncbi:lebercilin isoform X2 [Mugil cephalus]|uniref:lebercilin isoform X2 n=1 Tax=Mugil cephalus TaxID=48193 RepID=UPI001FB7C3B5|nr:lebercilin isoform X2 [Mugil cephalus]
MESENLTDPYQDNRDLSRQSLQSTRKDSRASSVQKHKKKFGDKIHSEEESRSKTRTWHSDPDRDQISDGEERKSNRSFYSDDYENESTSEHSSSPYSQSRTPSPSTQRGVRAKRTSNSPLYKMGGVGRRGAPRPQRPGGQLLALQHRRGVRSQSQESTPPKDLDLVTKRMLSARLLKINELRNALAELQQRTDELQKENRILRQLQVRQEKALQRYDDTESEISQLLSRHSNDIHVLRERLRRTQERERAAERRSKDSEEQLQRSQGTIARLRKLVDQRELAARDELTRRLEEEKTRAQEAERKIKELERSMELTNSSYQRQLVSEKKKTITAQEEIKTLQEELERLTNKLKEKERELDTKNIYANRMVKSSVRKDADSAQSGQGTKRIVPSRSSTKAVQTEDRMLSLDFPSPPPALTESNEYSEQAPDDYLTLKLDRVHRQVETEDSPQSQEEEKRRDKEKVREKELVKGKIQEKEEKEQLNQELNVLEEKAKTPRDALGKEKEEDRKGTSFMLNQKEGKNFWKHGHVQDEVEKWNHETLATEQAAEEARRKKELLLAKMREIDGQSQGYVFQSSPSEASKGTADHTSPRPPEQRNRNAPVFTDSEEVGGLRAGSRESGRRRAGIEGGAVTGAIGRRALRTQISSDDLAFGGYAPSFGHSASRASPGFPPPPPKEDRDSALEAIGIFNLTETEKGFGKERKSSLMQQLFGAQATPAGDSESPSNKMEVLNSPPATNGVRSRREGLLSFSSGSSTPPASSINTIHVADSRPAYRAIASFDDDIEELTL